MANLKRIVYLNSEEQASTLFSARSLALEDGRTILYDDNDLYLVRDTEEKVNRSGDTMTGILTLHREGTTVQDLPAGIQFSLKDTTLNTTYTGAYIYAYHDHQADGASLGANLVVRTGGNLLLASGENANTIYEASLKNSNEHIYLVADGNIYLQSKANTPAERSGFVLTNTHEILPVLAEVSTNNVGSIGNSTYKWNSIYATNFYGNLTGNASNITGVIAIENGGTNATTAEGARTNLGLGSMATEAATNYLKLSGGTMNGQLKWASSTALPQKTNPSYFLTIDSFANGGGTYYTNLANAKKALLETNDTHEDKFLRKDGTWQTPPYPINNNYGKITPANNTTTVTALTGNTTAIQASSSSENLKFTAANKWIVLAGVTSQTAGNNELKIAHILPTNMTNNGPSENQTGIRGSTFNIPKITVDEAGHVTEISSISVSLPESDNTNFTTHMYVNTTSGGATSNTATTNTNTYIHLYDDTTKRHTFQLKGSGDTTVTATAEGVITISSSSDDTKNTAGSTDSNSKLYLIGATEQSANPQTYSNGYVFETDGIFSAKALGVNYGTDTNKVTMQWNNTDQSLDFIFA